MNKLSRNRLNQDKKRNMSGRRPGRTDSSGRRPKGWKPKRAEGSGRWPGRRDRGRRDDSGGWPRFREPGRSDGSGGWHEILKPSRRVSCDRRPKLQKSGRSGGSGRWPKLQEPGWTGGLRAESGDLRAESARTELRSLELQGWRKSRPSCRADGEGKETWAAGTDASFVRAAETEAGSQAAGIVAWSAAEMSGGCAGKGGLWCRQEASWSMVAQRKQPFTKSNLKAICLFFF